MSEENVAVIRDAVEALRAEGLDAWAQFMADDIHYRAMEGAPDDRGPMHGRDAVRAYLQEWFDMFDGFKVEALELLDAGEDKVILVMRFAGRAKLSGIETDQTAAILYTIRDGKVARGKEFATREEAVEAAGMGEQ